METCPPPSWLDKTFLETVLKTDGETSSSQVLSYVISQAKAPGDGYVSNVYRVKVTLSDNQQRSLIVKILNIGGKAEQLMKECNGFGKETEVLTEILPRMHDLLQKVEENKFKPLSAKCLHAGDDPVPFIVMEDLAETGFRMVKREKGLDLTHCKLVLEALARFHASSIALHDQDPQVLRSFDTNVYSHRHKDLMTTFSDSGLDSLIKEIPTWVGYEEYAGMFENIKEIFFDRIVESCERKDNDLNCLGHGDLWPGNMLFRYSGDEVTDVMLIDFQNPLYSSPVIDLHYFFQAGCNANVRENHMEDIIEYYHSTLVETLKLLDCAQYIIPLEELKKNYEERSYFGFYVAAIVLPVVLSEGGGGFDIEKTLNAGGEAQEGNVSYKNKTYVDMMKPLLPIFKNKGFL